MKKLNQLVWIAVLGLPLGTAISQAQAAVIAPTSYVYDGAGQGAIPSTSPSFPDNTGGTNRELNNGVLPGSTAFGNAQWVGFQDPTDDGTSHPQVTFNLGGPHRLDEIVISYLHSTTQAGGSITAPEGVYVSLSDDGIAYSAATLFSSEFDSSAGDAIRFATLDMNGVSARYARLDFRNTAQWTFLAEVSFNGAPIPEPSTLVLLAFGVCFGLGVKRQRSRRLATNALSQPQ